MVLRAGCPAGQQGTGTAAGMSRTCCCLPRPPCLADILQERLGFTAQELAPISVEEEKPEAPQPQLPPWNKIGSPEDSLQNCLRLVGAAQAASEVE